ncbi:Cytochrome P450 4C1 [Araneus ventricosus]|uniref:Cytochrome P450 4C1 n=2 Tax=Araneus ventricosus TaxID=182803 RepID=A0A4Y1ZPL0_ARAVE|nr:Cytochrome P450 4C1 [Araneus ventricosus]
MLQAVLSSPEHIEKSREYRLLRPWIGTGLITSPRTKWHKHRKLVTPTFHFSILDTFIPVFQKQANVLISKIQSHIQEPWLDIVPLMSLCTLDIICETAMGVSMNLLCGENCDYSEAMHE